MTSSLQIQRPVAVHLQIERHLREQIREGLLRPGEKLPTAPELAEKLGVHVVTVQKALRRLKVEGILHRTPRVGTFVRDSLKNAQIAIFVGPNLVDENMHFYRALVRALQDLIPEQRYRVYDDLNLARKLEDFKKNPSYRRYLADLDSYIFEGIIVVGTGGRGEFINEPENVPRAAGGSSATGGVDVFFDRYHFTWECMNHLRSRNKTKVVYVRTLDDTEQATDAEGFYEAASRLEMEKTKVVQLKLHRENHYQEAVAYEKLCSLIERWNSSSSWPDALLVSDDIAMRGVALALVRNHSKVPKDLQIITWSNEGITHHYGIPVTKYEVRSSEFADQLYDILHKRMSGEQVIDLPRKIKGRIIHS